MHDTHIMSSGWTTYASRFVMLSGPSHPADATLGTIQSAPAGSIPPYVWPNFAISQIMNFVSFFDCLLRESAHLVCLPMLGTCIGGVLPQLRVSARLASS
jgi:hypothetical protein